MRVPTTINKNCLKAYHPTKQSAERWTGNKIQSFSIEAWDRNIPKSLQEQCIECIAKNWLEQQVLEEIVLLEDKLLLLDLLHETVPVELSVLCINDEGYWKKAYISRWPHKLPKIGNEIPLNFLAGTEEPFNKIPKESSELSSRDSSIKLSLQSQTSQEQQRTWKKCYCEMHLRDYLETLRPEDYNPEKIKELCDLCGPYVDVLEIHEMISSQSSCSKISLNAALTGLGNLKELTLRFKQTYVNDEFSWNIVTTSYQDINLFANGLRTIRLQVLRITDSDIDCDKAIIILKALNKHNLKVLDFSHCKIRDRGAVAIAKFIMLCPVREIYLANNRIGGNGVKGLAYAVAQECCHIQKLDLHLNQLGDQAGTILITSVAKYNKSIRSLLLSCCSLTEKFAVATALKSKNFLENLDISNNDLGEDMGLQLLNALKFNSTLQKFDVKMCKIPSPVEKDIQTEICKNRKGVDKSFADELIEDIYWNDVLVAEIEEALLTAHGSFGSHKEM